MGKPATGIFLQARMGSQRLPGKALLDLSEEPCLVHCMRALKRVPADVHALLTDEISMDDLGSHAQAEGFSLFVGPSEDVLARYCQAAQHYAVERVVRATGDNPLVSAEQAKLLLELHQENNWEVSRFQGPPVGTKVEVAEAWCLDWANRASRDSYEHEHVTPYLYRNPGIFRVEEPCCPTRWHMPEARVTLDTGEDYEWLKGIYAELYRGKPIETEELVEWLKVRTPAERTR